MVKLRTAKYCNLKLLLVFLVVYGHLIEPIIDQSPTAGILYRLIYLVHMPAFSFLTGLFCKTPAGCLAQLKKLIPLYVLAQAAAVFVGGSAGLLTPYWHLWYLLSSCTWLFLARLWFCIGKNKGRVLVLLASVAAGCLCGYVPWIGRTLSLSRTIVFFPYFWAGLHCPAEFPWKKLRPAAAAALAAVALPACLQVHRIPVTFLYHADPFGSLTDGAAWRLVCYMLGGAWVLVLLAFMPDKRCGVTRIGADTLPVYIAHAPLVSFLRKWEIPWQYHVLTAAVIIGVIYMLSRWHRKLYGIISYDSCDGRDDRWLPFRKSTKSLRSRSIGFCCR